MLPVAVLPVCSILMESVIGLTLQVGELTAQLLLS